MDAKVSIKNKTKTFQNLNKNCLLAQENLINIQGSYDILEQYLWMSAIGLSVNQLKNDSYR